MLNVLRTSENMRYESSDFSELSYLLVPPVPPISSPRAQAVSSSAPNTPGQNPGFDQEKSHNYSHFELVAHVVSPRKPEIIVVELRVVNNCGKTAKCLYQIQIVALIGTLQKDNIAKA